MGLFGCCKKKPKQQVFPPPARPQVSLSPSKGQPSVSHLHEQQSYLQAPLDEGFAGSPDHWKAKETLRVQPTEFKFPGNLPQSPKLVNSANLKSNQILGNKSKVVPKMILRPEKAEDEQTQTRKFHETKDNPLPIHILNTGPTGIKRADHHITSPKRFRTTLAHRTSNGGKDYVIVVGEHGEDGLAVRRKSSPAKEVNKVLQLNQELPFGEEHIPSKKFHLELKQDSELSGKVHEPARERKVSTESDLLQKQLKRSRQSGSLLHKHNPKSEVRKRSLKMSSLTPSYDINLEREKSLESNVQGERDPTSKEALEIRKELPIPKTTSTLQMLEGSAQVSSMQKYSNSQNRSSQTFRESFDNDDSLYMSRMMLSPPVNHTRQVAREQALKRDHNSGSNEASDGKEIEFSPGLKRSQLHYFGQAEQQPSNKTLRLPDLTSRNKGGLLNPAEYERNEQSEVLPMRQARSASPKAHVGRITGYRTLPYKKLLSEIMMNQRPSTFKDSPDLMDASEATNNYVNKTTNISKGDTHPMIRQGSGSAQEQSNLIDKNTSLDKRSLRQDTHLTAGHTLGMPLQPTNGSSKSFVFDEDQMLHKHDYSVLDFSIAGMSGVKRDRRKLGIKADSKSRFNRTQMSQSVLGGHSKDDGEEEVRQNKDLNTTYIQHTETVNPKKMRDYGCVASGTRTKINQYILLTPIGQGGWGEVFLSVDTNTKHKYVVPVL